MYLGFRNNSCVLNNRIAFHHMHDAFELSIYFPVGSEINSEIFTNINIHFFPLRNLKYDTFVNSFSSVLG